MKKTEMKKSGRKGRIFAVCAAAILTAGCLPGMSVNAFAQDYKITAYSLNAAESGFKEIDGNICYVKADGSYAKGWKEIEGKTYFFKSSGVMVTRSCTIGGIRYKFTSDGVCKGKYTGWVTKSGKRFYYFEGKKLSGWQKIKNSWYYFNEDGSAVTGRKTLFGSSLVFSSKGVWNGEVPDADWFSIYLLAEKKLKTDNYGYYSIDNGMFILHMKNPEAAEEYLEEWREKYPAIIVDTVKFSADELKAVKNTLTKNRKKFGFSDSWTDYNENCIQVSTKKITGSFREYLDSLPDSDIVKVTIQEVITIDD